MPDNISRLTLDDKEYIIVGTAHVSSDSVNDVETIIRSEIPDNVCIEIDAGRYQSMQNPNSWVNLDVAQVLKEGKGFFLLANLVLSSFQKRLGVDLGVKPGEEMKRGIEVAQELAIPFTFCDRDIQVTLKRAWQKSSFMSKNKMLAAMLSSVFYKEKLSKEEIENLKKKSELQNMMEELSGFLPSVKTVLIDERDRYLATNMFNASGKKIVAVVGAGHVPGIISILHKLKSGELANDLSDINTVPASKNYSKVLSWVIPALIIALVAFGFYSGGMQKGFLKFGVWWLFNGGFAAIGTLASLAHPLTILAAFLSAPIASLSPVLAVGVFTGLVEFYLKKPRVIDFNNISDDITSIRGFFKNRVIHIFIIFLFSSIGGMIGNFVGIPVAAAL